MRSHTALLAALVSLALATSPVRADTVRVADQEAFAKAVSEAKPGTTISVEPGVYRGGLHVRGVRGEAGSPIVITAAAKEDLPIFEGGLQLSRPAHLEIRDIIIRNAPANGLNIDDGGDAETPARHITLRRVVVRDIGGGGNRDGIKLSGVDDFVVEDCVVERWGGGGSGIDMVGCHRGVISGCTFRHREGEGSNAVQTKGGSRDITVRRCRFEHAGQRAVNIGGSTGLQFFRPRVEGFEAKDITVEDCVFVGSHSPVAFVGVDGAVVRHNVFYRPGRYALRILQETREPGFVPCRNGRFERNIIVFRGDEFGAAANIGPGTAPDTFTFAGNVWLCLDRPDRTDRFTRSLPTKETDARHGVDPRFRDAAKGDFRLEKDSPAKDAGVRWEEKAKD